MKKYRIYIAAAVIALVLILLYVFSGSSKSTVETIEIQVKSGTFEIQVSTSGELEAKTLKRSWDQWVSGISGSGT